MKNSLIILLLLSCLCLNGQNKYELKADGPYILYENGGLRFIQVDDSGNILDTVYSPVPKDFSFKVESEKKKHQFEVKLHSFSRPAWKDKKPGKMFIISDPHGDIDCFVSILKGGKIINENYQWAFGKNHLMIIGDVFDRGNGVLPIFWLIYKLEHEAAEVGGKVTFLLGNHEEMVLRGNLKYVKEEYKKLAENLNTPYESLWHADSELGRWLKTRNTMQIIGDNLFVHAGLSSEFLSKRLSIPMVNDTISRYLFQTKEERAVSPLATFLYGNSGPLWYRGMVRTDIQYNPINSYKEVEAILKEYGVSRMYVGHTIFTDITGFYKEKIIGVNVDNKDNREDKRARGVLIDGNKTYVVYDSGKLLEKF